MKFSSPANIALASIALSSPSILSSPVFVNAAPTMDNDSLSPNLGAGYFGNSPQMHVTDSPVMPTMASPPTSRIAGRRRSLRRSRSIKHRKDERPSRTIDPLGLGTSTSGTQREAEFIRPRMAPVGPLSGAHGTIDSFLPIVGSGGLLANTGVAPPNTPILGGVPLPNGFDPSLLSGAIPGVVPSPVVDNVIPIIPNIVSGDASNDILSSTLGSPPAVSQVAGTLTQNLGNPSQIVGGIPPLAGALPSVQGAVPQVSGFASQVTNSLTQVPGVVPLPDPNKLAPPSLVPGLAASPNVAMPPIPGSSPDAVVSWVSGALQLPAAIPQVPGAIGQTPGMIPQVSGMVPQVPGGTGAVPQVPGALAQAAPGLPIGLLSSNAPSGSPAPNLAGSVPIPLGSEVPLATPALPVTDLATPMSSAVLSVSSVVPSQRVKPTSISLSSVQPVAVTNVLAEPIESLAPLDPLVASAELVPHILVSEPDEIGAFEPLEGFGAGAMGRPGIDGAPAPGVPLEMDDGVLPKGSGEFDGRGNSDEHHGSQTISGTTSAIESRTRSWSATESGRSMVDRMTGELVPTNLPQPSAKLEIPTTTEFLSPKPTATEARVTISPGPTLEDAGILSTWRRWESKSTRLSSELGSNVADGSRVPVLSEGVPIPTSPMYVPPATRLRVPSHETIGVSRSASMVTLKSFSMVSISESPAPMPTRAQSVAQMIGGMSSSMALAQPTNHVATLSGDSFSSHSSEDGHPLLIPLTSNTVASSPIPTAYNGGVSLSRTLERSADTPSSTFAINGDSPNMPSPTLLSTGTSTGSLSMATRKTFRWGVPRMVTSTIRSVATAVKK
ncbi:mucin 2, oligomeric mucus/gel-forming [Rhizoctonia solani]|uniref:Mucin 2, oligomeric mucus/gel-forming n=1 Tax=Rhizoctonia solani TaxID=456999 RepID=A0A8H8NXM6_9AGAM|nr:mucin 2, oligomeric mucus/gel-forming [Rhizoctonia solani]QRW22006.1 mucin 2, oligomeric mucus/gel-forming [Rhizoctonia solani]